MKIEFHPLVAKDWNEIMDYYEEISPRAARKFDSQFMAMLAGHPTKFSPYLGSSVFRRARLRDFPHLVIYRIIPGGIRVTTVKHERRHPNFGMRRSKVNCGAHKLRWFVQRASPDPYPRGTHGRMPGQDCAGEVGGQDVRAALGSQERNGP